MSAFLPLYTPDAGERRQRQQIADAIPRAGLLDPTIRTQDFTAVAGGTYRVAGAAVRVMLPPPAPELYGKSVTLFLESGAASVWQAGVTSQLSDLSSVGRYVFSCSIGGWRTDELADGSVTDSELAADAAFGRLIAVTSYLTAGSGSHVPQASTKYVVADIAGASGGTGGCTTGGAGTAGAVSGSGAGAYNRIAFIPSGSISYTVGAGGAAGSAVGPTDGSAGGASSVTTPSGVRSAAGGNGSVACTAAAAAAIFVAATGGATPASTESVVRSGGGDATQAIVLAANAAAGSGAGANSHFGGGGAGRTPGANTGQAGLVGKGPGAGSGGPCVRGTGTAQNGTAGVDGAVIFYEFA